MFKGLSRDVKRVAPRTIRASAALAGSAAVGAFLSLSFTTAETRGLGMAIGAVAGFALAETLRRRRWERRIDLSLQRLDDDARRVMRDLARQRQDSVQLRDALIATGETLSQQNRALAQAGAAPTTEQRMLRTIAADLSRLSDMDETGEAVALPGATPLDVAISQAGIKGAESLRTLGDAQVVNIVRAAVESDSIDLFTQPIVTLPQRRPRFVEAFSRIRIRDGLHMPAAIYIKAAAAHNLLPAIDNLLLLESLRALRAASQSDPGIAYFCNVTSLTLHDPKFMSDLVEFISQNRALAQRLVFELTQSDLATMRHDIGPILSGLARLGCRFSIDQVEDLMLDPGALLMRHVRFVKVDAKLLLEAQRMPGGFERLRRLQDSLGREGIDMIVSRVENEKQLVELLDLGIDYGQGYLFGRPELHFADPKES